MQKREIGLYPVLVIVTVEFLLLFLLFFFLVQQKIAFPRKVLAIVTQDLSNATLKAGSEKDSVELPKDFLVLVSGKSDEKKIYMEEHAEIEWKGYLDEKIAGEYILTSAFKDRRYVFEGKMPQVKVTVME